MKYSNLLMEKKRFIRVAGHSMMVATQGKVGDGGHDMDREIEGLSETA